mgnify:CR=1 FL=1
MSEIQHQPISSTFSNYTYHIQTTVLLANMLFTVPLTLAAAARAKTAVLPLKHVVKATSIKSLVQKGQARIHKVNGQASTSTHVLVSSGSVTNEDVSYVAPVVIGGKTWELIVDTGCT